MQFNQLIEVQKSGALKSVVHDDGTVTLGGVLLNQQQLAVFARKLGWLKWEMNTTEIIEKTNRFIRNTAKNITDDRIIMGTEVTFENSRLSGTMRYFDRIRLVNPMFNYTVLYNMPSTGGVYAIYDADQHTHLPVYSCRSLKQVAEFFNELFN